MANLASLTPFFFLFCIVSHCVSRPVAPESSNAAATKFGEEYWFKHHAHAPMPNGGYKWPIPEKQWPHADGPVPAEGWKWHPHWPLAKSPFPCPWWPKKEVAAAADEQVQEEPVASPPLVA